MNSVDKIYSPSLCGWFLFGPSLLRESTFLEVPRNGRHDGTCGAQRTLTCLRVQNWQRSTGQQEEFTSRPTVSIVSSIAAVGPVPVCCCHLSYSHYYG